MQRGRDFESQRGRAGVKVTCGYLEVWIRHCYSGTMLMLHRCGCFCDHLKVDVCGLKVSRSAGRWILRVLDVVLELVLELAQDKSGSKHCFLVAPDYCSTMIVTGHLMDQVGVEPTLTRTGNKAVGWVLRKRHEQGREEHLWAHPPTVIAGKNTAHQCQNQTRHRRHGAHLVVWHRLASRS